MKTKAIICDLDGTLIDCTHRRHFVEGEKKDWKSFLDPENIKKDTINKWCYNLLIAISREGYEIIFVTGRNESTREITIENMESRNCYYTDDLFMRKDGDYRPDSVIKKEIYHEHIEPNYDILFCIDDRKCVTEMWRSLGLICLQCHEGNF